MCNNPFFDDSRINPINGRLIPIPCGHCEGCRIDKLTLWRQRLTSEYIKQRSAFLTLTYDDYHLKYNKGSVYPTADISDVGRFFDSLRHSIRYHVSKGFQIPEFCTDRFKFFSVTEYGERTNRPHIHALVFGLDWIKFYDFFEKTWKNGFVDCRPILKGGINYVLDYVQKQQFGESVLRKFFDYGCEPPKMTCSPGLGKEYFISQISNINKYGCMKIGNRFVPVPSYWKNKLFNYCDKNVWNVYLEQKARSDKVEEWCFYQGFSSYDSYLRSARKALEHSLEVRSLRRGQPSYQIAKSIRPYRFDSVQELMLAYPDKDFHWLYS